MAFIKVRGKIHPDCPQDGMALIDEKYVELLSGYYLKWTVQGYVRLTIREGDRVTYKCLHRFLYEHEHGTTIPTGMVIHHIDSQRWNNQLSNLMLTTRSHNNAAASRKTPNSSSQYKGVVFDKEKRKWKGKICTGDGKSISLGYFNDEIEAAKSRDRAFVAVHGTSIGSNELLSEVEIEDIKDNRDLYMPQPKYRNRERNIQYQNNKFHVIFKKPDLKVEDVFYTLAEAIEFRNDTMERYNKFKKDLLHKNPVQRNSKGVAIIPVKIPQSTDVKYAQVDDDNYYNALQYTWLLDSYGYAHSSKLCKQMQRFIIQNDDTEKVIDHINGDRLDNRRINLRTVSYSVQNRNKRKRDGCSSEYVGVSYHKLCAKWQAIMTLNGKTLQLGMFDTEEQAHQRYELERQKIEGIDYRGPRASKS